MVLGGAWVILPALLGFLLLARVDLAAAWLAQLGAWAIVTYILIFAVTSGLGLLPTYAQALAGGWIFGLQTGTLGALAGFTGGAIIGRIVAANIVHRDVDTIFAQAPKAGVVRDALLHRSRTKALGVITLLRIPPNAPFALSNLALTACGAPWLAYIVGTALGMTPRTAVIVGLGAAGAATGADSVGGLLEQGTSLWMIAGGIASAVVVLGILGVIGQRAIARMTQQS